jgi:hypothetical protein
MAIAYGTQTSLVLFTESTYGTAGTSGIKQPFVSESLKVSQQSLDSNTISSRRERLKPALSNINVSGSIATELATETSMFLLYAALGGYTGSSTGTSPNIIYTHTFKTGSSAHPSFTAEVNFGGSASGSRQYSRFNGCKINNLNLQIPNSGFITASYDVIGQTEVVSSTPLDSAPFIPSGFTPFSSFDASVSYTTTYNGTTGLPAFSTASGVIESASFAVNNALDESMYAIQANGLRSDLPAGFQSVTGQLSVLFDGAAATSLLAAADSTTSVALQFVLSRGTGAGSSGNEKITIVINNCVIEKTSPEVSGPGGVKVALSFKAFVPSATSNAMTITVLSPTVVLADSSGAITIPA